MNMIVDGRYERPAALQHRAEALADLRRAVHAALETYSNVHRGSGHNSLVSTRLFEQAREIVLEHLKLDKLKYTVIFCSPRRAELLKAQLRRGSYRCLSSQDLGLPLGIRALAIARTALPGGVPFQTGGGTARLVFPGSVIWAKAPDRFEAGTPAIANVIAFARALQLSRQFGDQVFPNAPARGLLASDILFRDDLEAYSGRQLLSELRQVLVGHGVHVPTVAGSQAFVNLDNAASTPTFMPVWEAVWQAWDQPGPVQQEIIGQVKSICAGALGAPADTYEVIFTSNTTEAINLVAESLRNDREQGIEPVVINTSLEHNSNELPWRMVPGCSLIRLPVDAEGFVDLNVLEGLLAAYNQKHQHGRKRIRLVTVSGASNVLGVCNDLAGIARIVHLYGARLLVDAAQLVAHRKVDMQRWGIDFLAFSAHKVYAPFGTGVLLARKGLLTFSLREMELIRSSGEENAAGIAALGKALVLLQRIGLDVIQEEEQALTRRALQGLAQVPGLTIYGIKDSQSPRFSQRGGVIVFQLEHILANAVARELAERGGIGVRAGCHCAHLLIKRLLGIGPLLASFQGLIVSLFSQVSLPGLTRISLGIENTTEDVDLLIRVLSEIVQHPPAGLDNPFAPVQTDIQRQMEDFARMAARKVYAQLR